MSSRYSVFYCKKEPDGQFKEVNLSCESPEFEDKELTDFSQDWGEVVYLAEQDNVGFIHYEHWKKGLLIRRLKYNDDYSWLSSDGEPEQWETELLFSPESLEMTLRAYDPERHQEIRQIWERKRIESGDFFPQLGSINLIGILTRFWKLPT